MLEKVSYENHPELCQLVDRRYLRGYVLSRLVQEGRVDLALDLLRAYSKGDVLLPDRMSIVSNLKDTMDNASRARSLPLLQQLHERNIGFCSVLAMDIAAANGDLPIVTFLHTHRTEGCSRRAFKKAKRHPAVLAFLKQNRPQDELVAPPSGGEMRGVVIPVLAAAACSIQ
ncbi:hypothetical protein ACHHYP_16248 [Achlya hypogyna]|uniref:Uncharacterized protein n=1 Tax=Achlya hypogyna TaxID=1202772 RepID=A0A1V9Y996_ACHHY|nr:hypothetical protein ACHHYP_16248 [Achlya hypogyna]